MIASTSSRLVLLTSLFITSHSLVDATIKYMKSYAPIINIAPVADLEVELSTHSPWWPDDLAWVAVWPHQTALAAAQHFCETFGNWNQSCAPNLAGHLAPLLTLDHDIRAARALQDASLNRSITDYLSYDVATVDVATDAAAYTAARIALAYNPAAVLKLPALMAIATALQLHASPRLLVFGSGKDSPFLCAAAIEGKPWPHIDKSEDNSRRIPSAVFVEDNPHWAETTSSALQEFLVSRGEDPQRCVVANVNFSFPQSSDTLPRRRDQWIAALGRPEPLADAIIEQLAAELFPAPDGLDAREATHRDVERSAGICSEISAPFSANTTTNGQQSLRAVIQQQLCGTFNVVLVDGPVGAGHASPGRAASIAAAAAAVESSHGTVFLDDVDRFVEQVLGQVLAITPCIMLFNDFLS